MKTGSRRAFLKTLGMFAASPASSAQLKPSGAEEKNVQRRTSFAPTSELRKLSEHLYFLEDTCNVYLIRDGSHAILIDFGSGKILDYLPGLGITEVDWILHTHHHRDQCQGDYKAAERSIPIAVPAHEQHLFSDAENFWRNRRVFHLYYVRNDFNTLTENIPVASMLRDYGTFRWNKRDIFVLPTPGHTLGSVSLVMDVDGKKTAFQMQIQPGASTQAEIRVQNYRKQPMKMEIALVAPSEWHIEPDVLRFEATAGNKARQAFSIQVPRDWRPSSPRFAVAADVVCDGKYLGQITEAVVDVGLPI